MPSDTPVVLAPPAPLALEDLGRIAAGAPAALGPEVAARCAASQRQVETLLRSGRVVYGLNTGCGPLCERVVPAADNAAFQQNLVRSHASGLGPAHPRAVVRATMAARAFSLAQGRSGVRPAVVETLVAALNAGVHPVIPEVGSVGASGDLVELAHLACALMGEGEVEHRGVRRPAREALAAAGLAPLAYAGREALALMNGTACETAQAALLVLGAETLVAAAEAAAALGVEVLGGSPEAFDARVHAVRPHPGQTACAARLRALLAGSRRLRPDVPPVAGERVPPVQDAYTLRCVPQVLGAVRATVAHVRGVVEAELASVTDNPTFFPEENAVLHAGNFHGQPVALAVDHLKVALAEVALFSERRLARLLDPAQNGGLPPFLIRDRPGVRSGLMGLQYCASSTVADDAVLAHPATLGSVPTNANNQDVVGMGSVGVRQARRLLENARRVVAIELVAAAEAADLIGLGAFAPGTRAVHAAVRERVAPLVEDRPLGADVERLAAALEDVAAAEG
ncbi:MAG TPA: aromatic amino acid ammonia-lyase [Candidatus Binatia bacterium]|nr:aromatic amino acid ammonia-lyase [Candidatus Binatia bacterium]